MLVTEASRRIPRAFRAHNFDPAAKRAAEDAARALYVETGSRFRVEYRDHYNDSCVSGDYVVTRVY